MHVISKGIRDRPLPDTSSGGLSPWRTKFNRPDDPCVFGGLRTLPSTVWTPSHFAGAIIPCTFDWIGHCTQFQRKPAPLRKTKLETYLLLVKNTPYVYWSTDNHLKYKTAHPNQCKPLISHKTHHNDHGSLHNWSEGAPSPGCATITWKVIKKKLLVGGILHGMGQRLVTPHANHSASYQCSIVHAIYVQGARA